MTSGSLSNYSSSDMIRDDQKRQMKCVKYVAYMGTMHTKWREVPGRDDRAFKGVYRIHMTKKKSSIVGIIKINLHVP